MNNIRTKVVSFFSFVIEFSLQLETELHVNEFFLILFTILGSLMPQSYVIIPKHIESRNTSFYQAIAKIVRPNLILPQSEYGYLIALLTIAIMIFFKYLLVFHFFANKQDQLKQNRMFKVITFLNQIYDVWLVNPIFEIILFSSTSLLFLPLMVYLSFLIFRLTITKAQLFLQQDNFNVSNTSIFVYLIQILNLSLIIVFCNNSDITGNLTIYIMILGLLINVLSVVNTIWYCPFLNSTISNIVLAIHCNSFVYTFCCLLNMRTYYAIDQLEIVALIVLPCYFKAAEYYSYNTLLLSIVEQNNPHRLVYLILYLKQDVKYQVQRVLIEAIVCQSEKKMQAKQISQKSVNQDDLLDFYQAISVKHQELSNNDQIAHLSLLLRLELYFQAYICISREGSQKQTSLINKIKFQICAGKCREKLNYHMMVKNNVDMGKEDANIEKYMEIETKNLELHKRVSKIIGQKILYFKQFQQENINQLYRDSCKMISDMENLLKYVKKFYQVYPTHKVQNVIAFIYAELLNDYLSALKASNQAGLDDETLFKNQTNTKLDLYSTKTAYVIINLDDYKIIRHSNNACDFFQVDQIILNDLIPNGIREYHNSMIENFIKTGKSKFFRKVENGLFIQNGFTEAASMSTEIIFQEHQLHALMILSVQEDNQIIMIVDSNYRIVGLSAEFFEIVGGKPEQIELIYEIPVDYVIPNFKYYAQDQDAIQHLEVRFLTPANLFNFVTLLIQQKIKKNITDLMDTYWRDSSNYDIFRTHCKIQNNSEQYFIVRFNYLKNQSTNQSMSRILTQKTMKTIVNLANPEIQYDESIVKLLPYDEIKCEKIKKGKIQKQIEQVQQSSERLFSNRESGNIEGCELLDEQPEQAKSYFYKNSYQAADYTQNQMVSIKQTKQQVYFQNNNEPESVSKDESKEVEIEGRSSQLTTMARQKRALFYKKYVLVEKMIQSQNTNQVSKILLMMVLLQSFVLILQVIISLISTRDTFTSYLTNIDLLQIKYYLFSPLESFIVTRYTIINYNAQYSAKTISSKQLKNYLTFPNSNLNLGFDDVQNNLAEILNRLTLQDFLAEDYEIYIYTDTNAGQLYNITMRQVLSILVNYQYTFKAAYIYDGKTVSDSPYIYYSYRNLLILYDAFDSLNQQLYIQNILQIESDKDKELKMFYPFVIVILVLIALQSLWFQKSQSKISALLGLLTFSDPYRMQKDIERLTSIADDINRHHDHLFKYQFHLDKKEGYLQILSKLMGVQRLQYRKQNMSNKRAFSLIFIQLFLIITFTIAKYSMNLNYFIKFGPTSYFYQQITDLGTNVPTIYAMREVLYYRWRYPFYTTNDTNSIMNQVETCLQQVQNTTSFIQTLQNENYLYSSEFFTNLSVIQSSNICNLLTPEMYAKSESLCGVTMAGSFLNGLTGSLIYIYQSIYTEMQINQFLNKTSDTINELEGAFIMSQVIKELNTNMKSDLTFQTNNQLSIVTIICILAFLYAAISKLILCLMIQPFLSKQYYMAKRFLYLIPQQTLFLDDVFERVARSVMQEQQIIN